MYKKISWCFLLLIISLMLGCQRQNSIPKEKDLMQVKSARGEHAKKIIFLMIDSLMSQAINKGIEQQELPTFQFLIEHGQYYQNLVSSFPTMSVTIDSSLLTGTYPDDHHVPGLTWYSSDQKKVINYGTGPMEVFKHGIDPVLADALIHLNGSHLNRQQPTLYEDLARHGLKSGSVNGLIYRGTTDHTLSVPLWIQVPASLPKEIQVKGPDFLALGSLSNPLEGIKKLPDGITRRMGLNNPYSIDTAKYLIKANQLPDFLYVYLPDLDQKIHKKGPSERDGIQEIDGQLLTLLQTFGTPEEALRKAIFVIAGDSGATQILPAQSDPVIDLPAFFRGDHVLRPGENLSQETDIVLAVNETMAYVYKLKADRSLRDMANALKSDPRIDFIAWKENEWIRAVQGGSFKELAFKANGRLTDPYRQKWTVEQDAEVLDVKINASEGTLAYGQYPDALQRLSGALNSHPGEFLVVTAKPGYELADRSSPKHKGGGGHGSLHQTESLIPLIICGTDQKPQYLRIVDLKAFVLDLLIQPPQPL
ncbi:alkaline phosphatase family protein [Paenibacillus naphthalenovorans]|uniref:Phosphodiesterase n=1 Tax=Paenibacillus naphthalenovorans TaxID=162209 RepID=A0A0U2U896_9BACL|nr:alkaline phosphatase family protein [Paenibacillus naphthalenovorans]ALS22569.1 phosphodiesterase [Paenibacillus naphthalenovorans]